MDEEKKAERAIEKTTTSGSDAGNTPKAPSIVDNANTAAERLEKANAKKEELQDREEALYEKKLSHGQAEAGAIKPKPVKLTDEEYTEAYKRGEVDPFKEDGIVM